MKAQLVIVQRALNDVTEIKNATLAFTSDVKRVVEEVGAGSTFRGTLPF